MQPLISFIVPAYNVPEPLLRECIESIIAVNLDGKEIIVVDDGSSEPIAPSPLFTLVRMENGGTASARNKGLEVAKGKYIQFVDADDCLIPEEYSKVVHLLKKGETDVIAFDFSSSKEVKDAGRLSEHFSGRELLMKQNLRGIVWLYAFRKDILKDLKFDKSLYQEDELFVPLLMLRAEKLLRTYIHAYFYRHLDASKSNTLMPEAVERRLCDTYSIILRLRNMKDPALERRVNQLCMDYLYCIWRDTRSMAEIKRRLRGLKSEKLFPLPVRCYTLKYWLFSLLTHLF